MISFTASCPIYKFDEVDFGDSKSLGRIGWRQLGDAEQLLVRSASLARQFSTYQNEAREMEPWSWVIWRSKLSCWTKREVGWRHNDHWRRVDRIDPPNHRCLQLPIDVLWSPCSFKRDCTMEAWKVRWRWRWPSVQRFNCFKVHRQPEFPARLWTVYISMCRASCFSGTHSGSLMRSCRRKCTNSLFITSKVSPQEAVTEELLVSEFITF